MQDEKIDQFFVEVNIEEKQTDTVEDRPDLLLEEILSRPSFHQPKRNGIVRAEFESSRKTIGVNLGELVNVIETYTTTVPEYQRDLRHVDEQEAQSFHRTTFLDGQLDIVPIIIVEIDGIVESMIQKRDGIKHGTRMNEEELLTERIYRYQQLTRDGKRFFNLDGQTRIKLYKDYYSPTSDKLIWYGERPSNNWEMKHDNQFSKFGINGMAFKDLTEGQRNGIYENLDCTLIIVKTSSHEVPSTTFSVANGGVSQIQTLTDMNSSFNGMRNQIEKLNLRKDSMNYPRHIKDGFEYYRERFYKSVSTPDSMFSEAAKGQYAFDIMQAIYLFGDRMSHPVAKNLHGCLNFIIKGVRSWENVVPVVVHPDTVLDDYTELKLDESKTAKSIAIRELRETNRELKYSMSTKVNAVYFEEILLTSERNIHKLSDLFIDFFIFDREEREKTMYYLVTANDVETNKEYNWTDADIDKTKFMAKGKYVLNADDYYYWGKDQVTVAKIKSRKERINQFFQENLETWIKKGYLS